MKKPTKAIIAAGCQGRYRERFSGDIPESAIAMSSAMSIGAGCLCGALHGAMLALDMFFGRTTQAGPKAPR